jgi:hypothetical protein
MHLLADQTMGPISWFACIVPEGTGTRTAGARTFSEWIIAEHVHATCGLMDFLVMAAMSASTILSVSTGKSICVLVVGRNSNEESMKE